jgi:hypothetical protein
MNGKNGGGEHFLQIAGLSYFSRLIPMRNFYRIFQKLRKTLRYSGFKPWEGKA